MRKSPSRIKRKRAFAITLYQILGKEVCFGFGQRNVLFAKIGFGVRAKTSGCLGIAPRRILGIIGSSGLGVHGFSSPGRWFDRSHAGAWEPSETRAGGCNATPASAVRGSR